MDDKDLPGDQLRRKPITLLPGAGDADSEFDSTGSGELSVMRPVVFDLDLTLIRSAGREAWMSVLESHGLSSDDAEASYLAGVGYAVGETVRTAFPTASQTQVSRILEDFEARYITAGSKQMEGASETMLALRSAGHPLYLSTGASPTMLRVALETHGWLETFDLALGSTPELPKGVQHLRCFAKHEGTSFVEWARSALTVGDGAGEMRSGVKAGLQLRCAFVPESDRHARELLRDAGANLFVTSLGELVLLAAHQSPLSEPRWAIDR